MLPQARHIEATKNARSHSPVSRHENARYFGGLDGVENDSRGSSMARRRNANGTTSPMPTRIQRLGGLTAALMIGAAARAMISKPLASTAA
jgi:hypothetical protein